ncbi:MAG: hypothetical protein SGARI_002124, partial [Bacillariaceae sp.]
TAYFEIPEGLKHGDPLICSYPECRNRGVKFLYCTFCKDPVAKRNFRNRHNHGMTTEGDSSETKSKASTSAAGGPAKVTSGSSASDGSGSSEGKTIRKGDGNKKRSAAAAALADLSASEHPAVRNKLARLEMTDPDRAKAWQLLLPTRPQAENEECMSAWLMRVMAVSDTARPISEVLSNLELVPPQGQEAKPTEVPMTHSETEEDTNEDSNDTSGSGEKPESSASTSSPQDGSPSSINDSSNMDSNESNESSSDNGLREDNDNNNGYSSETQDPMGSSPTESTSSDDSNDSSSSENNQEGLKRKFASMLSTSSDKTDEAETDKYSSTENREDHKYSSQESGVSSSGSN